MSTHRIKPGKAPKLHKIDTAGTPDWSKDREAGEARALELNKEFEALQELLYAENNKEEVSNIVESSSHAHIEIAEALLAGDQVRTEKAVAAHLRDVEARMLERLV